MTLKLGLIGYGAIGKHIEAAGLENIELASVLVRRPRNGRGKLTHDPGSSSRTASTRSPNAPATTPCVRMGRRSSTMERTSS